MMMHVYEADPQSGAGNCTCGAPERHPRHPHAFVKAWGGVRHVDEPRCTCMRGQSDPIHQPTDLEPADADSHTGQAGTSGAQNHLDRSAT